MINDFHFSYDLFSCDSFNVSAVNNLILNSWLDYGCLVTPVLELDKYEDWVTLLEPGVRKRWTTALSHYLKSDMAGVYKSVSTFTQLDECFDYIDDNEVRTLLINQGEVERLNIQDGRQARNDAEVINVNNFDDSFAFTKSKDLRNCGISDGDNIDTVWDERFASLAKKTKTIVIIDRYFLRNLVDDMGIRKTSIEKFIDFLSTTGGKHSICIYSVGDPRDSQMYNEVLNYMDITLPRKPNYAGTISRLEIVVNDDERFQDKAHQRYFQFGEFTIELDLGMSIFRSYPLSASGFSFYRTMTNPVVTEAHKALSHRVLWKHTA